MSPARLEKYRVPEVLKEYFKTEYDYMIWINRKASSIRRFDTVRGTFGHPLKSAYKTMLLPLFQSWDGYCQYTGIKLVMFPTCQLTPAQQVQQLSIDHVMVDGELQFKICSMKFNNIKEAYPSVEEFLKYCKTLNIGV